MGINQSIDAYRQSVRQTPVHPVKLVQMMFERTLMHLELAEEGVLEKNPKKRGENLGKAIALISELNASVKQDDKAEAAQFLRGLYQAILVELPKVAINGDTSILARAHKYISRLKEIWDGTAMQENGFDEDHGMDRGQDVKRTLEREKISRAVAADGSRLDEASVEKRVSVSI